VVGEFPDTLLREVELAAVRSWPAFEQIEVEGWLYRRSAGGSIRANSVATLDSSARDVMSAIGRVEDLARGRGVAACFAISDASVPIDLDARLEARGYMLGAPHVTMAKIIVAAAQPPPGMEIGDGPSPGWMAAYLSGLEENRREAAPKLLKGLPKTARFVSALVGGRVISSGLTIVDATVASVQCMATLLDARRQGGAERVLKAIETIAGVTGAQYLYAQTGGDNEKAQALYAQYGFRVIGHYHTRTKRLG
jgi:N-acetylglutamate synthase